MQTVNVDIAIVGAGGGGLRAAIAAAQANPNLKIALVSKVYPMRSHTVAAEGGQRRSLKRKTLMTNTFRTPSQVVTGFVNKTLSNISWSTHR